MWPVFFIAAKCFNIISAWCFRSNGGTGYMECQSLPSPQIPNSLTSLYPQWTQLEPPMFWRCSSKTRKR